MLYTYNSRVFRRHYVYAASRTLPDMYRGSVVARAFLVHFFTRLRFDFLFFLQRRSEYIHICVFTMNKKKKKNVLCDRLLIIIIRERPSGRHHVQDVYLGRCLIYLHSNITIIWSIDRISAKHTRLEPWVFYSFFIFFIFLVSAWK